MQYPIKNLVPNTSEWTLHPNAVATGPYSIATNASASWNTSAVKIPIVFGKTYTISVVSLTGYGRIEVWQNGGNTCVIDDNTEKVKQFTAVSDTAEVRFVNRSQLVGMITMDRLQVEEGTVQTPFEPYTLGMKPASAMKKRMNQQIINSDTTGTGGHKYGVGNVMYVKKDIKLNDSQIIVSSAGTFNVAVYEWVDGVGVVGQAIWKRDANYDIGTYTYSFGGLILREGKKYWFGRYDETNAANVGRTIGLGTVDYKTISTFGGARFTDSSIAFGTTYYYFYSLEVEDLDMRISTTYAGELKPAILYPTPSGMKAL